jgi:transcriptional regulator GlxA family with amidase domain
MGSAAAADPRVVFVVAFPGVLGLDVVGPLEVFTMANRFGASPVYATSVVSMSGGMIAASSGLVIGSVRAEAVAGPIDTLLVAGGYLSR